ncbi:MAG: alpha/beta hydrolase, partial [Candidatus Rokubacteria bacterium]|nr:alpha/beta hydrolase [Candidatus Rokubacteria bacterium]
SEPCEALSAHGFLGLDAEVVAAVAAWITGATGPR